MTSIWWIMYTFQNWRTTLKNLVVHCSCSFFQIHILKLLHCIYIRIFGFISNFMYLSTTGDIDLVDYVYLSKLKNNFEKPCCSLLLQFFSNSYTQTFTLYLHKDFRFYIKFYVFVDALWHRSLSERWIMHTYQNWRTVSLRVPKTLWRKSLW